MTSELDMSKVVVVGNNHHNTLGLVRSLGRGGMDVLCVVVCGGIKHSFVEKSCYVHEFKLVSSFDELLHYFIYELCVECQIPAFTTSDEAAEFLDIHYDELKSKLILNSCGGKQGGIAYWQNKDIMLAAAEECGLAIPHSFRLKLCPNSIIDRPDIYFPCVVKPQNSCNAGKDAFRICYNKEQLSKALCEVSKFCTDVLIQEYVKHDYEFLIMGMRSSRSGLIVLPGGLHKLRVCHHIKSLGMLVYAFTIGEMDSFIDTKAINHFLERMDYDGVFSMEFMVSNQKAVFLEINLRNDGTQFCFEGAGVNLPVLWVKESLGEDTSLYQKVLEKKYCLVEVNYIKNMDWRHSLIAFREWRKASLFAFADKKDWKPAIYKLLYAFKS